MELQAKRISHDTHGSNSSSSSNDLQYSSRAEPAKQQSHEFGPK